MKTYVTYGFFMALGCLRVMLRLKRSFAFNVIDTMHSLEQRSPCRGLAWDLEHLGHYLIH